MLIKHPYLSLSTFVATLCLGTLIATSWIHITSEAAEFDRSSISALTVEQLGPTAIYTNEAPEFDPNTDYAKTSKVKLLQTGEFHADEVPYRSGENWLGLFRRGDSYVLEPTLLRNRKFESDDEPYDREISTTNPSDAVFLLRGAGNLPRGKVDTVYDSERNVKFDLTAGWSFRIRGVFWKLWIENPGPDGNPQKGSTLLFQRGGFEPQVLRTLPNGCNDCTWRLLWAGDLNTDTDLDFLIDLSDHYNVSQPTLFFSSDANPDKVRVVASFRGVGC